MGATTDLDSTAMDLAVDSTSSAEVGSMVVGSAVKVGSAVAC